MKKKQRLLAVCAGLISLVMAGTANAALHSRIGAVYDDVANLTWVAMPASPKPVVTMQMGG